MVANLIKATENLPAVLVAQALAASTATVYLGPPAKSTVIGTASVYNKTILGDGGGDRTANLFLTKASGGTAQIAEITLEPGESCVVDELIGLYIGPGDSISGNSDGVASSIDIGITGAVSA